MQRLLVQAEIKAIHTLVNERICQRHVVDRKSRSTYYYGVYLAGTCTHRLQRWLILVHEVVDQ